MWHGLVGDASLYEFLSLCDQEIATQARSAGCPHCGGRLHSARYPRKPRGAACDLGVDYESRLSLCCAREGCRRRTTPASLRFLGRKVYLGAIVVLAAAMRQGPSPKRVAKLRRLVGVDRRTLVRWRRWWSETLPATRLWKAERGRFARPVKEQQLPCSLLERLAGGPRDQLIAMLRFLSPLSSQSAGAS